MRAFASRSLPQPSLRRPSSRRPSSRRQPLSLLLLVLLPLLALPPPVTRAAVGRQASAVLPNTGTTLVLHAIRRDPANRCFTPQDRGFDCGPGGRPRVSVGALEVFDVYVYLRHYDALNGLQCAFSWPGDWRYLGWGPAPAGGCQSQQLTAVTPQEPGGPTAGTLATVFDCVTGGWLTPIGSLTLVTGLAGCLSITDSSYPSGTHVIDCHGAPAPLAPAGWGRVCVGGGGIDACDALEPVAASSWGRIKAAFAP